MAYTRYPTPYYDVNAVLDELLSSVKQVVGPRFVGMYLGGSLATGDFDPLRSDIDFLVVTTEDLPEDIASRLKAMHARITGGESKWGKELEGCYIPQHAVRRYLPTEGAYPMIERNEELVIARSDSHQVVQRYILREHGISLAGPDIKTLIDPISVGQVQQAVLDTLRIWRSLTLGDTKGYLNIPGFRAYAVLTMCRILYTLHHGSVESKRVAATWARGLLGEPTASVIERALAWEPGKDTVDMDEALDIIRYTIQRGSQVQF
jgi:hypothetical protein